MKNYVKANIGNEGRVELHETLGLTGAEVSINQLPAGTGVPFVHSHKQNEEILRHPLRQGQCRPGRRDRSADRRRLAEGVPRRQAAVFRRCRHWDGLRLHPGQGALPGGLHRRRRCGVLI